MNMHYCQYENTYNDLVDCVESMDIEPESESEAKYLMKLINLCKLIAEEYGGDGTMKYRVYKQTMPMSESQEEQVSVIGKWEMELETALAYIEGVVLTLNDYQVCSDDDEITGVIYRIKDEHGRIVHTDESQEAA